MTNGPDNHDFDWLDTLTKRHPGWFFSLAPSTTHPKWCAVPAPDNATAASVFRLTGEITATTPEALSALVAERYGWHDYCETCGDLARECGHRQPERER